MLSRRKLSTNSRGASTVGHARQLVRRRLRCRADWPSLPARRTAKLSRRRRAHPRRALRSTPPHPPGRGPTGAGGHHQPRRRRSGDRHHVSGRVHGHDVRRLGPPTHLLQHPAGQVADTSTTSYDKLGQVTKVTDNTGEARYTYGGTDANGQVETRGLVTRVEQTSGGVTHSAPTPTPAPQLRTSPGSAGPRPPTPPGAP